MSTRSLLPFFSAMALLAGACGSGNGVHGYDSLSRDVEKNRVGDDADQWIELKGLSGEWEKVGLIFGYGDDYSACLKAMAALKKDYFRETEFRCVRAN